MPVLIGTSGWQYKHWREGLYPARLPQTRWLEHYADRFDTVELNNSFYRLPEPSAFEGWRRRLPDGFVVAVKASRYLTHVKRLHEPAQPVRLMMERASLLREKLGPVLLQLPPNLAQDLGLLDAALDVFPDGVKVAVEFRHPSWFSDDCRHVLEEHSSALCIADGGAVDSPLWRTASWGYLRLHSGRAAPQACYGRAALAGWAKRVAGLWTADETVYVYFNNDLHGCAPRNARTFASEVLAAGLVPSKVPGRGEVPLTA